MFIQISAPQSNACAQHAGERIKVLVFWNTGRFEGKYQQTSPPAGRQTWFIVTFQHHHRANTCVRRRSHLKWEGQSDPNHFISSHLKAKWYIKKQHQHTQMEHIANDNSQSHKKKVHLNNTQIIHKRKRKHHDWSYFANPIWDDFPSNTNICWKLLCRNLTLNDLHLPGVG